MSVSCPSKSVLDQLADWARWEAELAADPTAVESALVTRLSQVRDLRRRRGLRHRLVLILALAACATLVVGSDSVTAIWQWAARTEAGSVFLVGAIEHARGAERFNADAFERRSYSWSRDFAGMGLHP